MKRVGVFVTAVMLAGPTATRAQETLVESAMRHAQTLARTSPAPKPARAAQTQQPAPGLGAATGLSKRTKILIAFGAAAAFAAVALSIDHGVVNNTPSTLGTRKD
jgi:hypothetical protein